MTTVLGHQRDLFDVDDDTAYFNTATMSPLLHSVHDAGESALRRRARPWTVGADDWFTDVERLRGLVATLFNADTDGIALVPSSSYGMAVAARNVGIAAGQRVVLLGQEFPSSYYTWQRCAERHDAKLDLVEREPGESWTDAVVAAIDERTAVVVVPNVHWTNGAWVDLSAVKARAGEVGAAFVVDASQSLGAMPFDVAALRPDFVVSVGYKWQLGAVGLSYLYVDERHRGGEALEENWAGRAGAEDFASLVDYRDEYQPGSRRFDVGQRPNFGLIPMSIAAVEQLLAWGFENITAALEVVTGAIATAAEQIGLAPAPRAERGPHMLGVELPSREALDRALASLADAGVVVSVRGTSLRISPHLHNTPGDIERLVAALRAAV